METIPEEVSAQLPRALPHGWLGRTMSHILHPAHGAQADRHIDPGAFDQIPDELTLDLDVILFEAEKITNAPW